MKSILETAEEVGNLRTFVKALQGSKMKDTFDGEGPFTIFAPSDEAFSKLPKETREQFLNNDDLMMDLLKFHTVQDRVLSKDIKKMKSAESMLGERLYFDTTNVIEVNHAKVTEADIKCTNGVIQVIDNVMIPGKPLIKSV